jgi:hypothetical protein
MLRGLIHKPYNHGNSWKIKTRGCELMIKWFMDCIPTDVVEGKRYCILGNLLTANLGQKFIVDDCVLIRDYTACRDNLKAFYQQYVLPLHEYVEKPQSDTYFVKE